MRIDAGFTGTFQETEKSYPKKSSLSFEDQLKFKYQMVIDGNTYCERLPKYLGSGSVVFRAGIFAEWFEERIKPGTEYVSVDLDFSKFVEDLKHYRDHDDEARKIAKQSRETAKTQLRHLDAECYLARLSLEYSTLLEDIEP